MDEITSTTVVRAVAHQVSSTVGDEAVVLGLDNGMYYGLNEVGARVWSLVQEPISVGAIRDGLLEEFEVDRDRCERDLMTLLTDLKKESLIEVVDP